MDNSDRKRKWKMCEVMPCIGVDDLEKGVGFYNKLGFKEIWRYPEPAIEAKNHQYTHMGIAMENISIMLFLHAESSNPIQRQSLYFFLEGIEAYHQFLKTVRELKVPDLITTDYQMKDFSFTDPWGHFLTFGEGHAVE